MRTVENTPVTTRGLGKPCHVSARVSELAVQFGIPVVDAASPPTIDSGEFGLSAGKLVAVVGPSGSGKSRTLAALQERFPTATVVQHALFPDHGGIVDGLAGSEPLSCALSLLTACGLGEPRLWARRYEKLSDGEKLRARLAWAVAKQMQTGADAPLLCDEFCSGLHRRVTRAIAYNLHKLTRRHGLNVVVATCDEDVLIDLRPDVVVRLGTGGRDCTEAFAESEPPPFLTHPHIERGNKNDYEPFAAMHYRPGDELGFVDRVFVLRESPGGEALAIVVYAYPPLELHLRNRATEGLFKRQPALLNRDVRILRRLVVHPDVRGCGVGHGLVRATLPQVGTPYVECLAAMGTVNPVFERAGMQRIGRCGLTLQQRAALKRVQACGVDPFSRDFVTVACRRPRVRRMVAEVVGRWYEATTSAWETRLAQHTPESLARTFRSLLGSRPVYYLWHTEGRSFEAVPDEGPSTQA